jgi:hypothetical protein
VVVEAVRLFKRNATEREKRLDWLAERIGFELVVAFRRTMAASRLQASVASTH